MYNSSFTPNRSQFNSRPQGGEGGRPSYSRPSGGQGGSFRSGGPSRFGGGGGRSFGGRGGGGGRFGAKRPAGLNPLVFVKKAAPPEFEEKYVAKHTFADFAFTPKLLSNILAKGYVHPTHIQDESIGPALEGRDVIGLANTGTGKTAAFVLPILSKIMANQSERALIMAPTRELAMQIQSEIRSFTGGMPIYSTLCTGGMNMRTQIYELRRNPSIVIGTPGRLKDLVERRELDLSSFGTIVLDEVDRMLDMGFIVDIRELLAKLKPERQTLFFSATSAPEIDRLIATFTNNPVKVSVKKQETALNVEQDVIYARGRDEKMRVLKEMLGKPEFKKVIVFGRTKMGVEEVSRDLYANGFKVSSLHGDKMQMKRTQTIRMFREDAISILVATDVAARGLDIPDVTHVINFDAPATYDEYVHRIGRTGRANKAGVALTFV